MPASSRQIGDVELSRNESTTIYSAKFFVPEAELDSFIPEIGSSVSWTPVPCVAASYHKAWLGPGCWIVSVSARPADSSDSDYDKKSLDDFVRKSYSVGELFLPADWFGARTATMQDSAEFDSSGNLKPGERRFLNVEEGWCRPGDAIFCNAVPYEVSPDGSDKTPKASASKGSANYVRSPFATASASIPASLVNQSVKTRIYECVFYTRRLPRNISDFIGVSGSFSADCRPFDASDGRWKSLDQSVENLLDSDGAEWTRVFRRMMLAPLSLKWDSAKNGGTWRW